MMNANKATPDNIGANSAAAFAVARVSVTGVGVVVALRVAGIVCWRR